jgi:heme exporter protein B
LPNEHSTLPAKLFAIAAKDVRLEFRSRLAFSTLLLFGIATVTLVSFSIGGAELSPAIASALYWIIIFFSAMTSLSHTFIKEQESGTLLGLKVAVSGVPVYLGKLLVNFLLLTVLMLLLTPLFFIFLDLSIEHYLVFGLLALLGDIALCAGTTLVAAIIAHATSRGALFAVLSFPVLIPPLLVLVIATTKLFAGDGWSEVIPAVQFLISYGMVMGYGSTFLFRFVWEE